MYESDLEGVDFVGGHSKISFRVKFDAQRMMTVDFLHTYEFIGYVACYLEGYPDTRQVLEGHWNSRVSLVSTSTLHFGDVISEVEAVGGEEFTFTCEAKAPTTYTVNADPWHFKLMGLSTC